MKQTRILIVDSSVLVCQVISQMLAGESSLQVVATCQKLDEVLQQIDRLRPDVLLLAADMTTPGIKDGIAFAERLMEQQPMPIILLSSLQTGDAHAAFDALERGVFSIIERPENPNDLAAMVAIKQRLLAKLQAAAVAKVSTPVVATKRIRPYHYRVKREGLPLIAIGASTGGVNAVEHLLKRFSSISPPIVIAQHLPASFIRPFAARLNARTQMTVLEAAHGAPLQNGYVYIAPANRKLTISKQAKQYVCHVEPESTERTSIDTLFMSVAETLGPDAIGIVLTGVGNDGAEGLRAMHERGAYTIVQDQESSLAYAMPQAAIAANAGAVQLPLRAIPRRVMDLCNNKEVA